ncbi:1-deoxy-D-xylulose-5-phosphate reductoisomerase [Dubosiella newyorkensis]|jgi:1-deoxy-D-xylulose-5-phosphate reductoisomerase|uniref:1-deoxy-D-xylulose 5-phosphate reductoisomerase n=1 Tax=Dubosiella newyorkensis TaxID=1862672 RepID=A0A1U7NJL2_9FIRM|nr:1-deoxy-D-xylulose-5-phosphate reductoisomerase [Dubosiella newyorkensis]MCI9041556.1 1-deoxy-D-xylulose-5-phosphate reductoisomerase [Dubosiella newyorkensis]OLU43859.1 1-deoxy-D-xylulose-5-phosphate reductoisomerase [Dubosiella newyorkensis]
MKPKRILLLGATGSIGTQTIDVIDQHPERFELVGVSAGHQEQKLKEIVDSHPSIQCVGLAKKPEIDFGDVQLFYGEGAMENCIKETEYDLLVNATVGFRGLKPTLASIEKGKDVALANKESLVAGGELVNEALERNGVRLYPIDSEHSAIFQCLQGNSTKEVKRLIITASGGSFRDKNREELKEVSVQEALAHPNWAMGQRITIDSATMVNKAFEVIEAHYLFNVPKEKIGVVLHKQSIVHSMVEYDDHAIMAQLGSADMRLPIQYALTYPERLPLHEKHPLDMLLSRTLDFKAMDEERYPMIKIAYEVIEKKGNLGAIFNGADEEAVQLFLSGKISFLQIEESIVQALLNSAYIEHPTYEQLAKSDQEAREFVKMYWS